MTKVWYDSHEAKDATPSDLGSTNRGWTEQGVLYRSRDLRSRPNDMRHLVHDRGLTRESIQKFRIGLFSPGVYMIPVYDDLGALMNVRYYRESDHKKWGPKGITTKMLYPLLGMNGANPLWICEGEFDAMVAIQNGIHAITTTAGATATPATLRENENYFGKHRRFVLAFDNDPAGYVAEAVVGLDTFPGRIDGIVAWPKDFKKDISDWFNGGGDATELADMIIPFTNDWGLGWIEYAIEEYKKQGKNPPRSYVDILARCRKPSFAVPDVPPVAAGDAWEPADESATPCAPPGSAAPSHDWFDPVAMWPTKGFLREYMDYAGDLTDAPDEFHAATALTIFGISTRRSIFHTFAARRIFPNFYTALIAPSSIYRKTTAINIGTSRVLSRVNNQLMLPREFSTERFLMHLAKISSLGLLCFSEMAELLDQFKRSYSEGILSLLTDFYDCPHTYQRETMKEGLQTITDVFLSIIGASTIDWLNKNVTADQAEGGFWPRFLFFIPREPKPFKDNPPPPRVDHETYLSYQLKELEGIKGETCFDKEAQKMFSAWSIDANNRARLPGAPDSISKYQSRLQTNIIKVAMLFQLSETRTLAITGDAMARAIALGEWLLRAYAHLQRYEFAKDRVEAAEQKLIKIVAKQPGVSERDAMRAMHASAKVFRSILESCVAKEFIEVRTGVRISGKRLTTLHPTADNQAAPKG